MPFLMKLSEDQIVPGPSLFDQVNDLFGRILQIVVHCDDVISGGVLKAAENGRMLSVIFQQSHSGDLFVPLRRFLYDTPGLIWAVVVYENQFVLKPAALKKVYRAPDGLR
jgi:hypothetical protein